MSLIPIQEFYWHELETYKNHLQQWYDWAEDLYTVDRNKIGLKIHNVDSKQQELRSFQLGRDNYYNFMSKVTRNLKRLGDREIRYYTVQGYSQTVNIRDGVIINQVL